MFGRSEAAGGEAPRPGARERAQMRRRLRRQRQMREALLLDLGALVYELHRQGRREPELLQAKAAELTAVDQEVRALAGALGSDQSVMQLVATGIAGSCENCGSLMTVDARYCASCGAPAVPALAAEPEPEDHAALATGLVAEPEVQAPGPEVAAEAPATEEPEAPEPEVAEPEAHAPEVAEPEAHEPEVAEPEAPEPEAAEPEPEIEEFEPAAEQFEPEPEAEIEEFEPEVEEFAPEVEQPEPAVEEPVGEDEDADGRVTERPRAPWGAPEDDGPQAAAADGASREQEEEPPRALADDAIDTATKALRSGLARGRNWLRGRRTED